MFEKRDYPWCKLALDGLHACEVRIFYRVKISALGVVYPISIIGEGGILRGIQFPGNFGLRSSADIRANCKKKKTTESDKKTEEDRD